MGFAHPYEGVEVVVAWLHHLHLSLVELLTLGWVLWVLVEGWLGLWPVFPQG